MTTQQPEALRLADALNSISGIFPLEVNAANELRRLYAENGTLRHKLQTLEELGDAGDDVQLLRMGYAAARLEIESLQAQLEAVGAGGVSALMAAPAQAVPQGWFDCGVEPRPLAYSLRDYHLAPGEGPLHFTWRDKPHRIVYDLIAAVRYYVAAGVTAAPAQAGEYPELPDLHSTGAPFWRAVFAWHDAHHGPEAINAADKLDMLVADMLRAYVDADRAARGAAQAAPVVADVQDEECDVPPFGWRCTREKDHEGPCAAVESPEDKAFVERGMRRIRDAEDAGRYRLLKRGQHWSVIDGAGNTLRAEVLDAAIDAAIAAQQGGA